MWLSNLIRDVRALWDYVCEGQFGDPTPPSTSASAQKVHVKTDKEAPNLFVGKIIDDGGITCQVVAHNNPSNMHVVFSEISWDRLGTYLDVGKVYPVYKHSSKYLGDKMQIWEISPKRMKRDTSQVLLAWEKDIGWTWDIDS
jgi:hypothetical protein